MSEEKPPRVWRDDRGDLWIETEPGNVTWVGATMRERIRDKIGAAPLEDVQEAYGLRELTEAVPVSARGLPGIIGNELV